MPDDHKLVGVKISAECLGRLFETGNVINMSIVRGLPSGAQLIDARWIGPEQVVYLTFTHDEFTPVSSGALIPIISIDTETRHATSDTE